MILIWCHKTWSYVPKSVSIEKIARFLAFLHLLNGGSIIIISQSIFYFIRSAMEFRFKREIVIILRLGGSQATL